MPSYEDLRRINQANSIINRSNVSMGLRPMYLHTEEDSLEQRQEEFLEESHLSPKLKNQIKEKVIETQERDIVTAEEYYLQKAQELGLEEEGYFEEELYADNFEEDGKPSFFDAEELDAEPLFETAARMRDPIAFATKNQGALSFSKTVLYTACAVISAVFLIFTFKPVSTAPDTNFEATKLQELTKTVSSKAPRSLIITSGNFSTKKSAEVYKKSLHERLGVPLIIVKHENTFSVQVGPAYAKHEDALLVFDELSRYSVRDLSIKIAS